MSTFVSEIIRPMDATRESDMPAIVAAIRKEGAASSRPRKQSILNNFENVNAAPAGSALLRPTRSVKEAAIFVGQNLI